MTKLIVFFSILCLVVIGLVMWAFGGLEFIGISAPGVVESVFAPVQSIYNVGK